MKRRLLVGTVTTGEVVQADDILLRRSLVGDRLRPDVTCVKAPSHGKLSRAIDPVVGEGHPARLDVRAACPACRTLPERRVGCRGDDHSGLEGPSHDQAIAGVEQTKRIVSLSVLPGIVLTLDS